MSATEGQPAPALDLPTDGGGRVTLAALKGKPAVVYFYPKDDTTGCTREAQDFTALAPDFAALGVPVIGVSKDTVKKHDRFKAKYDLAVILASDEDGAACEAWGVWVQKKLYGREYVGIVTTIRGLTVEVQIVKTRPDTRELLAVEGQPEIFLEVK